MKIYLAALLAMLSLKAFPQYRQPVSQDSAQQSIPATDTTALANLISGGGVTISNVTMTCDTQAIGTFLYLADPFGSPKWLVMSTGSITGAGDSADYFASTPFTTTGDAQLQTLVTSAIFDPCILEFDLTPENDTLQFQYFFASEEYPQFVCSEFNDVFGAFISGVNPDGGSYVSQNFALLPNSTLPVCVNSVNGGVSGNYNGITWSSDSCMSLGYSNYFINNWPEFPDDSGYVNPYIIFNGMTEVLTAKIAVVPESSYHLKLAIGDGGDRLYDSGVFLKASSLSSPSSTLTAVIDSSRGGMQLVQVSHEVYPTLTDSVLSDTMNLHSLQTGTLGGRQVAQSLDADYISVDPVIESQQAPVHPKYYNLAGQLVNWDFCPVGIYIMQTQEDGITVYKKVFKKYSAGSQNTY